MRCLVQGGSGDVTVRNRALELSLKSWLNCPLTNLSSLSLSFFVCKMGTIIISIPGLLQVLKEII